MASGNPGNSRFGYTKSFDQSTITLTLGMTFAYLLALLVCEYRVWVQFAQKVGSRCRQAPFTSRILHVIRTSTQAQMSRVNTGPIITRVQNMHTGRNIAIGQFPCNAVNKTISKTVHPSISVSVKPSLPVPAHIRVRAVYVRPEPLNNIPFIPFLATGVPTERFRLVATSHDSPDESFSAIRAFTLNFLSITIWVSRIVVPTTLFYNVQDLALRYPVFAPKGTLCYSSGGVFFSYLLNLLDCQLGSPYLFTSGNVPISCVPSFLFCHVAHVIGLRSWNKMCWVNTIANIAGMTQHFAFWPVPISKIISHSMRNDLCSTCCQESIAAYHARAGPQPARLSLLNFSPEAILFGLSKRVRRKIKFFCFHTFNYTTSDTRSQ